MSTKAVGKLTRAETKARRPLEILDAAFEEFVEKGYAATRIEDVAARLDVTKGTIYLYFANKEVLFEEVVRHVSSLFADLTIAIDRLEGSYTERLRGTLRLGYEKIAGDRRARELLRLSLAEGARFPHIVDRHHDEFIAPLVDAVHGVVVEGVAAGEFRDSAVTRMSDVVVSSLMHMSVWRLLFAERRPLDEAAFIEAHLDLVLKGLLRAPSEA